MSEEMKSILANRYRWLLRQIRNLLWGYVVTVVLVVLSGLLFLLDPLLIKWLIDTVLPARSLQLLGFATAALLCIYLVRLALSMASVLINSRTVQASSFRI